MPRRSGRCLRGCLVLFAVVSAVCVCGPALYWKFKKGLRLGPTSSPACTPCLCDCPPPLSLLKIAPGLANLSVTDVIFHEVQFDFLLFTTLAIGYYLNETGVVQLVLVHPMLFGKLSLGDLILMKLSISQWSKLKRMESKYLVSN
ncbi:hypothetical protein TEA_025634 [Camellia sinensis var. sinensis]|uniref:Uncharacterized protein n=1 Tax=Camellia sinensis var. sinensis TaxID=542762 RepID=A0A4S4DZ48_CAMSN|nr:hypothetical protein TEA_025634 [Camellia sinensis var. sinensis]